MSPRDVAEALPEGLRARYRASRLLGSGSFGRVLRATRVEDGREVAVKVLGREVREHPEVRERFLREGALTEGIASPYVAQVFEHGEAGGEPFIVFEFVDGETLEARRERHGGKVGLEDANRWFLDILAGLEAAHRVGVVHRDLKPENVLLGRDDRAILTDFGLARTVDTQTLLTRTGAVMGTIAYMPPDQFEAREPAPHWDVYAAAATYYELVSGRLPHGGGDVSQIYDRKRRKLDHPLRRLGVDIPAEADRYVEACLAPDPADRPDTAKQVRENFSAAWARAGRPASVTGSQAAVPAGGTSRVARRSEIPGLAGSEPTAPVVDQDARTAPVAAPPVGTGGGEGDPDAASVDGTRAGLRSGPYSAEESGEGGAPGGSGRGAGLAAAGVVVLGGLVGWLLPGGEPGAAEAPRPRREAEADAGVTAAAERPLRRRALAEELHRYVGQLRDEPAVQQALGLDPDLAPTEAEALALWTAARRVIPAALQGLGAVIFRLFREPVHPETFSPLVTLARIESHFRARGYDLSGVPPLYPEGQDPGIPAALARGVRFREDPGLAQHRRDGVVALHERIRARFAADPSRRWRTLRDIQEVEDEEALTGIMADEVRLYNPEGRPFLDPARVQGKAAYVTDTFGIDRSALPELRGELAPVPEGRDLVLALTGYRWREKHAARLVLTGADRAQEVTFVMPRRTDSHDDPNTRSVGYLWVHRALLPEEPLTMALRFEGLQPLGDPSFAVGIEEVHQLVEGEPPARVGEAPPAPPPPVAPDGGTLEGTPRG